MPETILTTTNIEALRDVFAEVFDVTTMEYETQYQKVFRTVSSTHHYEEDMKTAGLPRAEVIGEHQAFPVGKMHKRWINRYYHVFQANSFEMSFIAREDFKVNWIREPSARLTRSLITAKEAHHAAILNQAFSTSYPIGDGKPLCAVDHPLLSTGTASNRVATDTDLSVAGLAEALQLLRHTVDDRGDPIHLRAALLVVPPNLEYTARILLGTTQMPFTADNDINVLRQDLKGYVVWDFLVPDAWFVIAQESQHQLKTFSRMPVKAKFHENEKNWGLTFQAAERYIAGASDWVGIVGSPGA